MPERKAINPNDLTAVLISSARRCCLCFGLNNDLERKEGQIAHLDHNRSNSAIDNLAWLCFIHHNEYDSKQSQGKGLTIQEVKQYRDRLYRAIAPQADINQPKSKVKYDNNSVDLPSTDSNNSRFYEPIP